MFICLAEGSQHTAELVQGVLNSKTENILWISEHKLSEQIATINDWQYIDDDDNEYIVSARSWKSMNFKNTSLWILAG